MRETRSRQEQNRRKAALREQCDVSYLLYTGPARNQMQYAEAMQAWSVEDQARHRDALMNDVRQDDRYL